jgi:hypothetical protein
MIRRIFKILAAVGVLLILFVGGVWFLLQPLGVPEVPPQERLVFSNVTVVNPGSERRAGQTLTAEDGQIVSITPQGPESSASEGTRRFAGA